MTNSKKSIFTKEDIAYMILSIMAFINAMTFNIVVSVLEKLS